MSETGDESVGVLGVAEDLRNYHGLPSLLPLAVPTSKPSTTVSFLYSTCLLPMRFIPDVLCVS